MTMLHRLSGWSAALLVALLWTLAGCSPDGRNETANAADSADSGESIASLDVYQDPNCGCCGQWVEHVRQNDFAAERHYLNPSELNQLKTERGIAPELQSCHTAVSEQGYVFEGHVPARLIEEFLAAPPENALGLTVPGMPVGSPGMEVGDRFQPYEVLMIEEGGSTQLFASISSPDEQ